ncbi:hypothetical protein ACFV1B_12430 [Streptomyces sp. NPDC059637]|uniref:hypothetical protein n=1 Tax=Streptomyces sp. NPDC059637 TaxID=3347752 RepID=UPI0036B91AD4
MGVPFAGSLRLAVLGAVAPRPTGSPDHGGRAPVLECEDNGVPVLVVTRREDMPLVLGALRPAPSERDAGAG